MLSFLKGIGLALLITCLGTAALALVFTDTSAAETWILALSVVIKLVSVAAGTFVTVKGLKKRGALCGLIVAAAWFFADCALGALLGAAVWSPALLADLGLTLIVGAICGVLTVSLT